MVLERTPKIYLIDGTYEPLRHYYAPSSAWDQDGREIAAVRGVLASVLGMVKDGATYLVVATDHVIESFRNGCGPVMGPPTASILICSSVPAARRDPLGSRHRRVALIEFEADDPLLPGR